MERAERVAMTTTFCQQNTENSQLETVWNQMETKPHLNSALLNIHVKNERKIDIKVSKYK
jgi:outer membrane receptor for monomeric catechols